MTVYKMPGSDIYTYQFQRGGKTYKKSTGTDNKREAERIERDAIQEVEQRLKEEKARASGRSVDMTFGQAVLRYMDEKGDDLDVIDRDFKRLLEWIGEDTPMSSIDAQTIHSVVERRKKDVKLNSKGDPILKKNPKTGLMETVPLEIATVNRSTWQVIKRIYIGARDRWKVPVQPIDWKPFGKMIGKEKIRTRELKLEEEALWEQHLREGYGSAFKFSLLSALRLDNLVTLRWDQIDWGTMEFSVIQKGDKPLIKKIDDYMLEVLLAEKGKHPEYVFSFICQRSWINAKTGEKYVKGERYPITYWGYTTWFRRTAKRLGITNLTRHDMRRTAGGRMLRMTGNLKATSMHLGHSDPAITSKRYAYVSPNDLMDIQNRTQALIEEQRQRLKAMGVITDPTKSNDQSTGSDEPVDTMQEVYRKSTGSGSK